LEPIVKQGHYRNIGPDEVDSTFQKSLKDRFFLRNCQLTVTNVAKDKKIVSPRAISYAAPGGNLIFKGKFTNNKEKTVDYNRIFTNNPLLSKLAFFQRILSNFFNSQLIERFFQQSIFKVDSVPS
jgi:hypothetical protein